MMKVKEMMVSDAASCTPETNLAAAAMLMWERDCGTLPIVANDGKVVGMITDRDICMAAATKHRDLAEIRVDEVISGRVHACQPETDIHDALRIIEQEQVRRLPVVDAEGKLQGILSMRDVVLYAGKAKDKKGLGLSDADIMRTFQAICAPHPATLQEQPQAATTAASA